jgi:hypothetical protein
MTVFWDAALMTEAVNTSETSISTTMHRETSQNKEHQKENLTI